MRSRHVLLACSFPFKEGPLNPGLHSEWIKFSVVSSAHMSEIHLRITRRWRGFSPCITPAAHRPLFSGKPGYMINILSLPGSAFPGFKSAWMLDFLKMYLSPHPASWGGIASRRQSHWGQNKSWQIFKLLLQSPGFSFISISGATYLPCWPSFLKGRENSFNRALYLFLPKSRLEMYGEWVFSAQLREKSAGLPLLSAAPPASPAQLSGETLNFSLSQAPSFSPGSMEAVCPTWLLAFTSRMAASSLLTARLLCSKSRESLRHRGRKGWLCTAEFRTPVLMSKFSSDTNA